MDLEHQALLGLRRQAPDRYPKSHLSALYLLRFFAAVLRNVPSPYLCQAIVQGGVDDRNVGYVFALLDTACTIAYLSAVNFLPKLADRYGRKIDITYSFLVIAFGTLVTGLSTTLIGIVISRVVVDCALGSATVSKAVVGESVNADDRGLHFALFHLVFQVGKSLSPLVGGLLTIERSQSKAVTESTFFLTHPHLLAPLCLALLSVFPLTFALARLRETLGRRRPETSADEKSETATSPRQEGKGGVAPIALTVALLCALQASFECLLLLFAFAPRTSGGLEFSPLQIGTLLAAYGMGNCLASMPVFPVAIKWFGPVRLARILTPLYPLSALWLCGLSRKVASSPRMSEARLGAALLPSLLGIVLTFLSIASMDIVVVQKSKGSLARTVSKVDSAASIGWMIGAGLSSVLLSATVSEYGCQLSFLALTIFGFVGVTLTRMIDIDA